MDDSRDVADDDREMVRVEKLESDLTIGGGDAASDETAHLDDEMINSSGSGVSEEGHSGGGGGVSEAGEDEEDALSLVSASGRPTHKEYKTFYCVLETKVENIGVQVGFRY